MIREATLQDVDAIVAMGAKFIFETKYAKLVSFTEDKLDVLCRLLVLAPDSVVLVAEKDGRLVGMIGVTLTAQPFSGDVMAAELFWWVNPESRGDGLRLLKAAETWATEHGATIMQMGAPDERVARVYRAFGYARAEELYQRRLG